MNAIAARKSRLQNRFEGFALTALFQAVPTFTGAVLLLKLTGASAIVGSPGGAAIFVTLAASFHALLTRWLAPKFPRFFRHGFEPLFFDASLSFAEKISRWRAQPATSLQLLTNVMLLSVLAIAVVSVG